MSPLCIQSNIRKVKTESLWMQYFKDPSHWWDNRNSSKASSRSPDFKHKVTAEALWLDCRYNPTWVFEELRKTEPTLTLELREGERQEEKGAVLLEETAHVVGLLKACANQKDLFKGTRLHEDIRKWGLLERSPYVASTLITMYAKCGALAKAQQVLDEHTVRDRFSWTALIAGYAQNGHGDEALKCFDKMRHEGHFPDSVTFTRALKACASVGSLDKGEQIHDEIVRWGLLEKSIVLGSALVDMYAKCGALEKAQGVLDELPVQNVVTWNALIAGYAKYGQGNEALKCFEKMRQVGYSPTAVSFTCALKACANIGALDKGEQICDEIVRLGWLGTNVVLGNAMVDMYGKCGAYAKAWRVLDKLPVRNVVSWSALIARYAQNGHGDEALRCFDKMRHEGHFPDSVTFTCALKACASVGALDKGEQIHDEIVKLGLLEKYIVLGNALVDMYAKCGAFAKAWRVLDKLPVRNVVSWSALIAGYAQNGHNDEALKCFDKMRQEGHFPDSVSFACALKVCANIGALDKGEQICDEIVRLTLLRRNVVLRNAMVKGEEIHDEINKLEWLERECVLGNAVVNMYAKCGAFTKAEGVLYELPVRGVVSWSSLIAGYAQHGQGKEALKCFDKMRWEGHIPHAVTLSSVLKACADIGDIDKGKEIHEEIARLGLLEGNVVLGSALVDMYAKCGTFTKAWEVFDELPARDVVSWSALIAGYASHGRSADVLDCFEQMQCEGVSPDPGTFVCMLNACSHSGLLDEGQMYFTKMSTNFGVTPDVQHHSCMVDLFGRAGEFNKALAVIEMMPSIDYLPVWMALLGACRKWKNVTLGRLAFDRILQIDKTNASAYVCMANIYAAAGMQEDAREIEVMRVVNKAWKKLGLMVD